MATHESLRPLDRAWPRPGILGAAPSRATPESVAAIRRAASAGDAGVVPLLALAWESDGALQQCVLDALAETLSTLPARGWTRVDASARPSWVRLAGPASESAQAAAELPIEAVIRAGLRRWDACSSLAEIRAELGEHVAALLLATMHRGGRVREAAVLALGDDVRALPALLVRANDWAAPVREAALSGLRRLAEPRHASAWLRAMPLVVRLADCGRASHGPVLDLVGELFRAEGPRRELLAAVGSADLPAARAAAAMALRAFGAGDRATAAARLACPDPLVRLRALDAPREALDDERVAAALRDPVPAVRRRALDVLRARGADGVPERLREACFDRSAAVREFALFHARKLATFDAGAFASEAAARLAAPRGGVLGPLSLLCELGARTYAATIWSHAAHPHGSVRLCAKRCLLRSLQADGAVDPRLLDDPSPRIARRLVAAVRARGVEPALAPMLRRFEESPTDDEARAWLGTIAKASPWDALPHVVRALDDPRPAVAARARQSVDVFVGRTFRTYVDPGGVRLAELASALARCRDPRAARVVEWVRAVTGRREWPPAPWPARPER